ncbi:MAG: Uncharacterised protein [SAR116 cluster bacterium]|nr:MAG: Uncharacterised protein [SAR116 cluster bacterium]
MARNTEQLRPCIIFLAKTGKPVSPASQDGRHNRNGFNVVDGCRAAIEAGPGRERRLQARLSFFAFQRFDQRGFLAANIGAGTTMQIDVEFPA